VVDGGGETDERRKINFAFVSSPVLPTNYFPTSAHPLTNRIYFPLEKKFQFIKETGATEELNELMLIDSQALFEKAFVLWSQRAFKSQEKR
jgi:hypothetical protein